ncbi:MAG: hypothetical protein IH614_18845 [Desulfuromonadales bacterium]|nr:hypothetical protein [Desulfuromonadales bacterium]
MMLKKMLIIALACVPMLTLVGCEREGPMERTGERVDRAVERAGDKAEDATDRR